MSARRAAFVLGSLEVFGPLSMDLSMPLLPQLAEDLHTKDSLAQASMSVCMLGLALGQLVTGPLSDRMGRRRPLLWGVALFTVFSLLCAFAPSIEILLVLRFLQGLAGSAGIVIALAAARDIASGIELARLLSLLGLVGALAPIVAPVAGGQLAAVLDWRGLFVVLAGIGVALLVVSATLLPETLPPELRHGGKFADTGRRFGTVLRDRLFVCYLLVGACTGTAFFTYLASISFVLQDGFHLSPQAFGAVFAMNAIVAVLGSLSNRAIVRRVGPARMYVVGTTATAVAALGLLGVVVAGLGLSVLLIALALVLFCYGVISPNSSTLALAGHGERAGTAAALLGMSSFAVGPVVAPLVALGGQAELTMALTMAIATVIACVLVWTTVLPRLRGSKDPAPPSEHRAGGAGVHHDDALH
ncbi:multidrug effflux MFS transporter [Streptomyces zagrosensis]|uniref:DHA1 family bicyclomycin/chloramphenicol resistance-like MFS transporter n=1 Tax=Streptomyces zagrosensis TaxID=1042984 RepID=A0A7W9QFZ7_9ACTN|nr:multidrug effflux MFS transporter [Streptomyces zagrosensis]MBB5939324.1 DHA1 family bicyclomycin/chloramphenicol resistance-like MFS transporter [Streptomyces zagrosensis]